MWNVGSGKLIRTIPIDDKGRAFTVAPGAERIASFGTEKGLRMWDATTGQTNREFDIAGMRQGALPSRATRARSQPRAPTKVRIWDTATGKEQVAVNGGLGGAIGTAFSPDGAMFVAAKSKFAFDASKFEMTVLKSIVLSSPFLAIIHSMTT